ncbi:MAG: hypothetical protein AAGA28_15505 [Pseudomonadota bacterium]
MRVWCVWLLVLLSAGPVLALSCLKPDVNTTFREAVRASEDYVVIYGILQFDGAAQPGQDFSQVEPETTRLPARLEGQALGKAGFRTAFAQDITLELACFGPWCGQAEPGAKYLAFLRDDRSHYVLTADPCNSWLFRDPSPSQLDAARQCMKGQCAPAEP